MAGWATLPQAAALVLLNLPLTAGEPSGAPEIVDPAGDARFGETSVPATPDVADGIDLLAAWFHNESREAFHVAVKVSDLHQADAHPAPWLFAYSVFFESEDGRHRYNALSYVSGGRWTHGLGHWIEDSPQGTIAIEGTLDLEVSVIDVTILKRLIEGTANDTWLHVLDAQTLAFLAGAYQGDIAYPSPDAHVPLAAYSGAPSEPLFRPSDPATQEPSAGAPGLAILGVASAVVWTARRFSPRA